MSLFVRFETDPSTPNGGRLSTSNKFLDLEGEFLLPSNNNIYRFRDGKVYKSTRDVRDTELVGLYDGYGYANCRLEGSSPSLTRSWPTTAAGTPREGP
jgi:hypothetical protein